MIDTTKTHRKAIVGNVHSSFWLYDSEKGFDLSHPVTPESPPVENAVLIQTTTQSVTIDPAKSALVIVDMQNFFLSPALGRSPQSKGLTAQSQLLKYAIPAARKAGIRIVWLNWGLTDQEVAEMPVAACKTFGFGTIDASSYGPFIRELTNSGDRSSRSQADTARSFDLELETLGKRRNIYVGLGNALGPVTLDNGSQTEAGRMLYRDQWNTALTPELAQAYQEGLRCSPPDTWIHKNRLSGLWGGSTPCSEFLDQHGIKTLLFAGVNTDQCVGGSLVDAFSRGYDCILVRDGAATTSPECAQEAYEFNAAGTYGFCTTCEDLFKGVEAQHRPR